MKVALNSFIKLQFKNIIFKMQIVVSLDGEPPINLQQIQTTQFLTNIVFEITIDARLEQKIYKLSALVPFLSEHPTITTRLKVKSVEKNPLKQYCMGAVGGTFDCLHIGHQILLLYAALSAKEALYLGITADALLVHKKYWELIQNLTVRMQNALNFVRSINPTVEVIAYELIDPFGSTVTQKRVQYVAFSPQPGDNLIQINIQRAKKDFCQLEVVRCPLLTPIQKYDQKFSSTYIRRELLERNSLTKEQLSQYRLYFYDLINEFKQLQNLIISNKKTAQLWLDFLFFSYSQSWRFYHTNRHIYQLLKRWHGPQFCQQRKNLSLKDRVTLQSALFFHDIVYKPGSLTNEKESAEICARFVRQNIGNQQHTQDVINEAKRLILQTEQHSKPTSNLSQIVYDLDMGVLNDPDLYKQYAQGVRKEYEPIFKNQYRKKRTEFLQRTLKQERYFSHAANHIQQNVKWQLEFLKKVRY